MEPTKPKNNEITELTELSTHTTTTVNPKTGSVTTITVNPDGSTTKYFTSYAKIESNFINDMWRTIKAGDERPKFQITHVNDSGETWLFKGLNILSDQDLASYITLGALASVSDEYRSGTILLRPIPKTESAKEHRETIKLKYNAVDAPMLKVKCSFYEFAKEMGYAPSSCGSGKTTKLIKESLDRLFDVTVKITAPDGKDSASFHLISQMQIHEDKTFSVALNPYLASAIFGRRHDTPFPDRQWTPISMNELRKIKSGPTRLILVKLARWIDPGGNPQVVRWNTLINYAWPEQPTTNPNTIRTRKYVINKALEEINALGTWKIVKDTKSRFIISRLKMPELLRNKNI